MIAAGVTYSIDWYRHRLVRSNADLIALLPDGSGTRFFVDVALLRRAGILAAFASGKLGEDPEYKHFGEETHFDYRQDLDALAGSLEGDRAKFLLRGRFDRRNLWRYAAARGGKCDNGSCQMPAITPGRWAYFVLLQSDLLALSVGPYSSEPAARSIIRAHGRFTSPSSDPVWVELPKQMLQTPAELPLPLQILATSLQSADPVILSVGSEGQDGARAFLLKLDAQFPNQPAAETVRKQLELETKSLSLALARQNHLSDPRDFTGLLASGSFHVSDRHVLGRWLIRPELIHALE